MANTVVADANQTPNGALNYIQLRDLARQAGFSADEAPYAAAIAIIENGNQTSYAYTGTNNPAGVGDGGGLMQLQNHDGVDVNNPLADMTAAHALFVANGNSFKPWVNFEGVGNAQANADKINHVVQMNEGGAPHASFDIRHLIPGYDAAQGAMAAANATAQGVKSVADFLGLLTNPQTWVKRILPILGGIVVFLMALAYLMRNQVPKVVPV